MLYRACVDDCGARESLLFTPVHGVVVECHGYNFACFVLLMARNNPDFLDRSMFFYDMARY